jgi:DNA-binding NtrC family response regulator
MPGFFRMAASPLSEHFRLLECFTLAEASGLIMLHQPELVVIDGRSITDPTQQRLQAAITAGRNCRFVIVVAHGAMRQMPFPPELARHTTVIPMLEGEFDPGEAVRRAIEDSTMPQPYGGDTEDPDGHPPDGAKSTTGTSTPPDNSKAGGTAPQPQCTQPHSTVHDTVPAPNNEEAAVSDKTSITARFRTRTPELRRMLQRLEVAATHNVTLLLIGETGSGKTHLAKLIHEVSPRSAEPFIHVACGALQGELIESELFGHVKGAFTSAHADKEGKFVAAGRGTILLDEIDVLSPDQQVKLLRVIETGQFEPVGCNQTLQVQARIIAASNLPLQPLVNQGRFRPDLYYRLNTLCFTIPPLRKRLPDVEPLARYFVHHHAQQHGIEVVEITQEFIDCLLSYPWPGNVREIENAIRSAVIYSVNGKMSADTLPMHIVAGQAGPSNDPSTAAFFAARDGDSLGERIELTEKDIIEQALLNNKFSRTNTARHLGISRVTLYNKMRKYGITAEK